MSSSDFADVTNASVVEPPHGLLLVDKPQGVTSHDVVSWARRALGTRRVGHTGTLDPMATGLLVLAVGEGTKLVAHLTEHDKRYTCTVQLGVETDSLDADGAVVRRVPVPRFTLEDVEYCLRALEQQTTQVPPMVSAVRVAGRRLYEHARRGASVEVSPRPVVLHRADVVAVRPDQIDLNLHCGKGFYVRALARDLSASLDTVGHLVSLRRVAVASDRVEQALAGDTLLRAARGDVDARMVARSELEAVATAIRRLPCVMLTEIGAAHARHGRAVPLGDASPAPQLDTATVLLDAAAQPIAIGRSDGQVITILRGFALA